MDALRSSDQKSSVGTTPTRRPLLSCKALRAIIPARNEERSIAEIIERTRPFCDEVVVVDGHSNDRTVAIAQATATGAGRYGQWEGQGGRRPGRGVCGPV